MSQKLKYISRIKDEFDTVICGVNGVIMRGSQIDAAALGTLIKMYQSGKRVMLSSNLSLRVGELFGLLKSAGVPMNIFCAMITAGEIAHFYLQNASSLGRCYYNMTSLPSKMMFGLNYQETRLLDKAHFVLAETVAEGINVEAQMPVLEQALRRGLPLVCVGNNTSVVSDNGQICAGAGALAEQYALLGGKVLSFGKPDVRIAAYLTENIADFQRSRCLVIGDGMATDMRLGYNFKAQTLLLTSGVHQLSADLGTQINELQANYGLHVDYYAETLQW